MALTTMEKKLVPLYVNQIRLKRKTIEDVPTKYHPYVIAECEALGLPYKKEEPIEEPKEEKPTEDIKEPTEAPSVIYDEGANKDQIADMQK